MSALAILMVADFVVAVLTCGIVYRHHRMEFSGPGSATSRILMALADMRTRVDMVERLIARKEV